MFKPRHHLAPLSIIALALLITSFSCSTDDADRGSGEGGTTLTDRGNSRSDQGRPQRDLGTAQDTACTDCPDQSADLATTDLSGDLVPDSVEQTDPIITTDVGEHSDLNDNCPEEAKDIYVVDGTAQVLYRFDPLTATFTRVLQLDCPAGMLSTPHSMAVSRDAEPYILYQDNKVYRINTEGVCSRTAFSVGMLSDWTLFGMGFAMNSRESTDDTLFVANNNTLGALNLTDFTIREIGSLPEGMPELTGTAWGELWGFFPQASPPVIAQIDKTTGAFLTVYELELSSDANAWAFAFWGGHFYIFYKTFSDSSTNVYRMSVEGGDLELVAGNTGRYIVGAGVSTCAPVKWPDD